MVGAFIALALPISCWVLAQLVEAGIAPYDQLRALLGPLCMIALAEVLLGPIGLYVAARGAGPRGSGPLPWIAVFGLGIPVFAFAWSATCPRLGQAAPSPEEGGT